MLEPDFAYAFPNDDGIVVLACVPAKQRLASFKADLEGAFTTFFQGLPDAPPIAAAERISEFRGMIEMPNIARSVTRPGVALIGDAAMTSDPLWGVGCGFAFQSAEWMADAVGPAVRRGPVHLDRALRRYGWQHRVRLAGHQFLMTDFSSGRALNPLERLVFSAAARDARTARHVHAYINRLIGVTGFLSPTALFRAARVSLRRAS
jgi:flavin-dependent dehydrogenase